MPPPDSHQVRVALDALRSDAGKWEGVADTFGSAARQAGRLDLSALHFTYLGDKVGLVDTYHAIQDTFVTLLNEGATNFENMAVVLRRAADDYERDDEAGAHDIRNATY
jgi:hypothetical protein